MSETGRNREETGKRQTGRQRESNRMDKDWERDTHLTSLARCYTVMISGCLITADFARNEGLGWRVAGIGVSDGKALICP